MTLRVLPGLMAAVLLISAAGATTSAQDFGAVGTTETVPCPDSIVKGAAFAKKGTEAEGQTYSCGVVVVPENHDQPDGRLIELLYLKLHSSGATPAADPMVYLSGGPGSSGSHELSGNPLLLQNLDRVRADRDIVTFDQRGSGYSNYLLCAPFESALGILQDRDTSPQIAEAITDLQNTDLGGGYLALRNNLCGVATRLLAGVDLGQYNSLSSAKDIAILLTALGYTDGFSLFGTSYGTRLAQYAMRAIPDGLKGVILDGSSGPAIPNTLLSFLKDVSTYQEVFAQCAADAACAAAYPDLPARFRALLEKLETTPFVIDPPIVVKPMLTTIGLPPVIKQIDAAFFRQISSLDNLAFAGAFAGAVPRMIKAVEDGDTDWFRRSPIAETADSTTPPAQIGDPVATDPTPGFPADQPLFAVPFETLLAFATATAAEAPAGPDGQWLAIALGDLAARLVAGEDQADLMEALLRLAVVPNQGTTAQVLTDYAKAHLSPAAAEAADAVVGTMSRNEVRSTLWNIQDVAMALSPYPDARSYSNGMQNAVNCADEVAFTTLDIAEKALADSPFPQLAAYPMSVNEATLAGCIAYPTPLDRSVTEPVVSDIPVLIHVGALDDETPAQWGRDVAKTLSRATVVEWPNMGHVATAHDPKLCAGDIVAAFLADPTKQPDVTCSRSDEYKLTFVLK